MKSLMKTAMTPQIVRTAVFCLTAVVSLSMVFPAAAQFPQDDSQWTKDQAIDWFKFTNVGGANGKMVPGVSKRVEEIIDEGKQVVMLVPAPLTKTKKYYFGMTWGGLFFPLEMTQRQARAAGLDDDGVTMYSSGGRSAKRRPQPVAQIDQLKIDNVNSLSGDRDITGEVFLRLLEPPRGKLVLRLGYKRKGSSITVTKPLRDITPDGRIRFRIDSVNRKEKERHTGPLPFFVDVCVEQGGGFDRNLEIVSNTLARLLEIPSPGRSAATRSSHTISRRTNRGGVSRVPSVSGTTWKFGGVDTRVTFLSGGRVKWSNSRYGGNWEQNGNRLSFDSNNYTLFEVTINGNKMSGIWRRLQGDDKDSTSPTSLTMVSAPR